MDSELSIGYLIRMTGGDEIVKATYRFQEGLVGRLRVQGDMVYGEVWDLKAFRARLQLVPPFEGKCSCAQGGACSHVAALGLEYLYQHARDAFDEESAYHKVMTLDERGLRGLAMELLANFKGTSLLAADFLLRHEVANLGAHPFTDEADAQKVWERLRIVLGGDLSDSERLTEADRQVRILVKAVAAHGSTAFRIISLACVVAELGAALDRYGPVAYRWRGMFHESLGTVVAFMERRTWPDSVEVACLRHLLNAYAASGNCTVGDLQAALLAATRTPVLRDWLEGESKRGWRSAPGTPRKRFRALLKEIARVPITLERSSTKPANIHSTPGV